MTKLLTYALCAFTALSVLAAPVDFGDIAADYPLYDSSDPFAIGVSTAAYTSATNANARIDALTLSMGISAATATNISTYVTAQHANRTDNPHGVTAAQAGAIANETDELALTALATNRVTRLFDSTGNRWIDGTGGVWQVSAVTNSTMANWTVTVISDIKNGSGTVVATNGTLEVFSDPIGVPPLALSQYAIQNVVHGGYRWSIYRASDASQLTVFVQNIGLSASQYLSQNMNPPTYTNAICTAWPGGLSSGQCRVTYTPIVYTVSVVTNALPRVAFLDDVPSTSGLLSTTGDGSQLTDMTVSQIAGAYPSANPSNFVTAASIPGPGCTDLGTNAVTITGATVSYGAQPTAAYTISVSPTAPRYCYALEIISTNAYTLGAGLNLRGTWTQTATNIVTFVPCTGTLWRVYGRGL